VTLQLLNILGPIMLITLIGYILGRSSVGLQSRTLSSLVILVATPSLVFSTLTSIEIDLSTIGRMSGAALLCLGIAAVAAIAGLKAFGAPVRAFLPSLMLPNSGNMGLPLVVLAFGAEGARLGVSFFFVVALFQYSVGLSIASCSVRVGDIAQQPLIYSVALVLLITAFDVTVPQVILTTTTMLGGMMIPAMLILLGTSLATLSVSDLGPSLGIAFGRLLIGLVSGTVVIALLGLEGLTAGIVFLMAAMPCAIVTYVFAERYQQAPNRVAGAVVMSTLLTFICLPALVWTALWMAEPTGLAVVLGAP
jgi:malate permease and related proteins